MEDICNVHDDQMKCSFEEIKSTEQKIDQIQDLLEMDSNSEQCRHRHRRQTDKLNRQEGCKNHNEIFVLITTFLDFGS